MQGQVYDKAKQDIIPSIGTGDHIDTKVLVQIKVPYIPRLNRIYSQIMVQVEDLYKGIGTEPSIGICRG